MARCIATTWSHGARDATAADVSQLNQDATASNGCGDRWRQTHRGFVGISRQAQNKRRKLQTVVAFRKKRASRSERKKR